MLITFEQKRFSPNICPTLTQKGVFSCLCHHSIQGDPGRNQNTSEIVSTCNFKQKVYINVSLGPSIGVT